MLLIMGHLSFTATPSVMIMSSLFPASDTGVSNFEARPELVRQVWRGFAIAADNEGRRPVKSTGDPGWATSNGSSLPSLSFKVMPPCGDGVLVHISRLSRGTTDSNLKDSNFGASKVGTLSFCNDVTCRPHKLLLMCSSLSLIG